MSAKLSYTYDEIVAECDFASRIRRGEVLFHGGLDQQGRYVPPRSRHRLDAIKAWTEQLAAQGHPTQVIRFEQLDLRFFPNVAQTKVLLRHGARSAMTRILTLIGITEGFGNDGLRGLPRPDWQPLFKESIENTCLAHLSKGLLDAHGNDEAGSATEAGHDQMWYAIRDAALNNPPVTPDMYENLPIAPPPGYSGPAKPSPDAIGVGEMKFLFPTLNPMFELLLSVFTQLLVIELLAYGTFAWAKEVLSDPDCSAAPDFAPRMVDYITADETIHVSYLQCALAETRARTVIDQDGKEIPGATVIDAICNKILNNPGAGPRRDRMLNYRMNQIRTELAARTDGAQILAEFAQLGPVPG
ncbi:MAG: hypothetical protein HYR72_18880 [Deltaproteobacteria bacterium]|nr:hypothetical protein [Deltaproteobacteria bacterium]MBI3386215.1 hypothetical protein [Deltaproteobacteria bacterium]